MIKAFYRSLIIAAFFSLVFWRSAHVYAQGLCIARGDVYAPAAPLGCASLFGNGKKYYISQGYEIYGYSGSGADSPLPTFATPLRVGANQNSSITGGVTMYSSLSIQAGATLRVPSGTVIRVRGGDCSINGAIVVSGAARGGERAGQLSPFSNEQGTAAPHPGISNRAAGFGAVGQSVEAIVGGPGGIGLDDVQAAQIHYPGLMGGGGGGGGSSEIGGAGGGSFVLLCEGRLRIDGAIYADGVTALGPGGGAGAGGVIVLASEDRIVLGANSTLSARGGDGGLATANTAPGGGGGGGIIRFISPTVRRNGTINVAGGSGQPAGSGTIQNVLRSGGGGGGACGGNGGAGGTVNGDLSYTSSGSGSPGYILESLTIPRYIFG